MYFLKSHLFKVGFLFFSEACSSFCYLSTQTPAPSIPWPLTFLAPSLLSLPKPFHSEFRASPIRQTDISHALCKGFRCLSDLQLLLGNLTQKPFQAVGSMNVPLLWRPMPGLGWTGSQPRLELDFHLGQSEGTIRYYRMLRLRVLYQPNFGGSIGGH